MITAAGAIRRYGVSLPPPAPCRLRCGTGPSGGTPHRFTRYGDPRVHIDVHRRGPFVAGDPSRLVIVPAAGRPDQYEYEIDIRPDDRFTTDAPCGRSQWRRHGASGSAGWCRSDRPLRGRPDRSSAMTRSAWP